MVTLESKVCSTAPDFIANRDGMLALLARLREVEMRAHDASTASRERFAKRRQLLPRERLSLQLDPGAPFIELSTLAEHERSKPFDAFPMYQTPAALRGGTT